MSKKTSLSLAGLLLIAAALGAQAAPGGMKKSVAQGRARVAASQQSLVSVVLPNGKGTGRIPSNREYAAPEMETGFAGQLGAAPLPSSVDLSSRVPPVGDQGSVGSCVCWATVYYYKTFLDSLQYDPDGTGGWVNSANNQRSPYFGWANGGGGWFDCCCELLKGHGACSLNQFGSYSVTPTATHFDEAAPYNVLRYEAFFTHAIKVDGPIPGGIFKSRYNNNVTALKQWLAGGQGFIIGIPVFNNFMNYETNAQGAIDVPDSDFTILGLHALFVMGYDDSRQAFRIRNSWGTTPWGDHGEAWLSYKFFQKLVDVAWRLYDATTFLPLGQASSVGDSKNEVSRDYAITYKGAGMMTVDATGVSIANAGVSDKLTIKRKRGVLVGNLIPQVTVAGSMSEIYTEGPISQVAVSGDLKRLTAQNCHVTTVAANTISSVKMTDAPNSTYADILWYWDAVPVYNTDWSDNYAETSIVESSSTPHKLSVQTSGVDMSRVEAPAADLTLKTASKKHSAKGVPPWLSYAGVGYVGYITGSNPEVEADVISSIGTAAGVIWADVYANSIKKISGAGGSYTCPTWGYADYFFGSVYPDTLECDGAIGSITAVGGDVLSDSASHIQAGGAIGAVSSKNIVFRNPYEGKRYSSGGNVLRTIVAGHGKTDAASCTISSVFGSLRVGNGGGADRMRILAGTDSQGLQNCAGAIKKIGTAKGGEVHGDGYFNGAPIIWVGNPNHGDFVPHTTP